MGAQTKVRYNTIMTVFLAIVYIVTMVLLFVVLGIRPQMTTHSTFELRRRIKNGDEEAAFLLHRNELMPDVFSLQRVLTAMLLVMLSAIGVVLFHWTLGVLVSLLIALEAGAIARIALLQHYSQKLYERYESKVLGFIEKYPLVFRAIHIVSPIPPDTYDIESREELLHMVEQSGDVLTADQKMLIQNSLGFDDRTVEEVMISRTAIDTINHDETLGPLVLDDLFKTTHSRIPVIKDSIDNVIGILYLRDVMHVGTHKKTRTAEQAMEKKVFYIRQDQSLWHALSAFIRTNHHLFIVLNEHRETVGILTLEDCMEALLGRAIKDEFDDDDQPEVVMKRTVTANNATKNGTNV